MVGGLGGPLDPEPMHLRASGIELPNARARAEVERLVLDVQLGSSRLWVGVGRVCVGRGCVGRGCVGRGGVGRGGVE